MSGIVKQLEVDEFGKEGSFPEIKGLKVALVHYWLLRRRGGERVLEALAEMLPQADIFTLVLEPEFLGDVLRGRHIHTSFLQNIPGSRRHYQKLLALCPMALESFDLHDYDLVISSESGPAKGVITRSDTLHICYCHSPMRYLWEMYLPYKRQAPGGRIGRAFYSVTSHYVRMWDHASADRVDYFVANSQNVAQRIWKTYRRLADVVYPPVDVDHFSLAPSHDDFYLVVSQLVAYKRIDLAITACNQLRRKLVVIGDGQEFGRLRRIAGPTVTMMGWQDEDVLRDHYSRCRALLFPGEEDFGITAVEAQASGRPVIALGQGGVVESVRGYRAAEEPIPSDPTGVFFREPSVESLSDAILEFERRETQFCPSTIRLQAQRFSTSRFKSQMMEFIKLKLHEFPYAYAQDQRKARSL
jgi:glycosyltransferase involved in cell wall biosynthesis